MCVIHFTNVLGGKPKCTHTIKREKKTGQTANQKQAIVRLIDDMATSPEHNNVIVSTFFQPIVSDNEMRFAQDIH